MLLWTSPALAVYQGTEVRPSDPGVSSTVFIDSVTMKVRHSECTGTLIGKGVDPSGKSYGLILTAAHCIASEEILKGKPTGKMLLSEDTVVAFTTSLTLEQIFDIKNSGMPHARAQAIAIPKETQLERVTSRSRNRRQGEEEYLDIALIRVEGMIPAEGVPAEYAKSKVNVNQGTPVFTLGYAATNEKGDGFGTLRRGDFTVRGRTHGGDWKFRSETNSVCHGDSGGPMYMPLKSGGDLLVGVTSRGSVNCTGPEASSIFTAVDQYTAWIQKASARFGALQFLETPQDQAILPLIDSTLSAR